MRRAGYVANNGIFYMLGDHLGSIGALLNQNGTIAKQEYYPFGGNRGSAFSNLTTKRFTGQYHEAGLPDGEGLSYYNGRWYDAQLGRFISADTLIPNPADPQSFNRLAYVQNNPLRYIDPSGHSIACGTIRGTCGGPPKRTAQYGYSEKYGWLDSSHIGLSVPNTILQNAEKAASTGKDVTFTIERKFIHRKFALLSLTYRVSGNITPEQITGVSLAIYMDLERRWEEWQGDIGPGDSKYAIEDLPSDYVGFYAAANNSTTDYALQQLGPFTWSDEGPPDPNLVMPALFPLPWEIRRIENQNTEFSPMVTDESGNYHNIPWPNSMQMTPINDNDIWQYESGTSSGWWAGWFVWPWQPE